MPYFIHLSLEISLIYNEIHNSLINKMYVRFVPAKAVDVEDTATDTMYHSLEESNPWWLLDLNEIRTIHAVEILSRKGCCSERLNNVEVSGD